MKNKLETVPFKDTPEQKAQLEQIIAEHKDIPGALVQVLKKAQEVYGYLPLEVQMAVADGLGVSLEEVYGVVTFYALFSIEPKGQHRISVCLGTACYVKGAQKVIDKFIEILGIKPGESTEDGLFTIDALRCIGACGIAPAVSINGKVYPKMSVASVADVIAEYRAKGGADA